MKILITSIIDLKRLQHSRLHQFVKYLSSRHDVTVIGIKDWWRADQCDSEGQDKWFEDDFNRCNRCNICYLTEKRVSPILQELFSANSVRQILRNEFDVHLNYSTLFSGYTAAKKLNTVYDIADDLGAMIRESPQIPVYFRPIGGVMGDLLVKKNIKISKLITTITPSLSKLYNVPLNKCKIIPNGVDTEFFRTYDSNLRNQFDLNSFVIGYVGTLREWVDFRPIFSALKELDARTILLIVGKEGLFDENKALAKEYGLADRVKFIGAVPYSQVPKYISCMDACIIPFKRIAISEHSIPLKLFEYMACEKPVISSKIQGVVKIAKDKVLYANTPEEYIVNINKLVNDSNLRLRLGRDGRKFILENYDWRKICKEMEENLQNIAES